MPTGQTPKGEISGEIVTLMGNAGNGKSIFAIQSPQPHAILCADRGQIPELPEFMYEPLGYDPALTFWHPFIPQEENLSGAKAKPSASVHNQFIKDLEALRDGLRSGKDFKMRGETWPIPRTIIIEGMDFVRDCIVDWVCHEHNQTHINGFTNRFEGWNYVNTESRKIYDMITRLGAIRNVNIVLTLGVKSEVQTKMVNGQSQQIDTGNMDPNFGGAQTDLMPRKISELWLAERAGGKYFMVVSPNNPRYKAYRGLRSGRFWDKEIVEQGGVIDVTLDITGKSPLVNQWNRLMAYK